MIGNKCKSNEKGITLLGLILTIIILLILAGVSIAMLTGENGIINKAKEHEIQAQLAIIEEAANIIYVEKKSLGIKNVDIGVVARQLQEDGYGIKVQAGDGIQCIKLVGPDIITIDKEYSLEVNPIPIEGEVEVLYYAVVKGKYYEIKNKDNRIEVMRTESDSSEWEEPNIITASTANAGYININNIDQDGMRISISGQNPPGSEELNVTWGKKTAKKQIKVLSKLKYLNEVVLKDYTEIPEDIKEKLAQEGYVVEEKTLTTIEEILLTSPKYMPIQYQSQITAEIKTSSDTSFYAVIDEEGNDGVVEYYKIVVKDGQVQAEMEPTNVNVEERELDVIPQNDRITVGTIDDTTNPITINITSLNNTGTETIEVTYGEVSRNCNIEVLSKLEYLDKLLENEDDISDDIIESVKDDGYTIIKVNDTKIDGIDLEYPSGIKTDETGKIIVRKLNEISTIKYYAEIYEVYYEIIEEDNKIITNKNGKNYSEIIAKENKVEANVSNSSLTFTINGFEIDIRGVSVGTSTINVSYGDKTASCIIKVTPTISGLKNNGQEVGEKTTTTDDNGDEITIPEGFKVSSSSATLVKDGIVVIAPDGSEFVWVPVKNINSMVMCKSYTELSVCNITEVGDELVCTTHSNSNDLYGKLYAESWTDNFITDFTAHKYNNLCREPTVLTDTTFGDYKSKCLGYLKSIVGLTGTNDEIKVQWSTNLKNEYKEMAKSVYENKGFYVGRYETSLRNSNTIAQSKANQKAATFESSSANTWYGMYKKQKDYSENNLLTDVVGSTMIWGSQFDQMMFWMIDNGINVKSKSSSSLKGAVRNDTTTTGGSGNKDILNNIYDLWGCKFEITLESASNKYRSQRGSKANDKNYFPAYRSMCSPDDTFSYLGSRLSLYIK